MTLYETLNGIACNIGSFTTVAESPTKFISIVRLIDDAALALLPTATTVNIPISDIFVLIATLVLDSEAIDLHIAHIIKPDVTLCAFVVYRHLSYFCNKGIAIMT